MLNQYIFTCGGGNCIGSRFLFSYIGDEERALSCISDWLSNGIGYNFDGTGDYAFGRVVVNSIEYNGELIRCGVFEFSCGVWLYHSSQS